MRLAGKKAFITGATGLIGGRLAERLTNEEHAEVRTLVRSPEKVGHLASIGIELVQGDVTDPASVRRAMEGCSLAFHCAALMHDADATLEGFRQVNVGGTANVLDAATDAGVELLVYISSIAVYGIDPRVHTDETGTFQTTGIPYSDSNTEAEELVARHAERTNLPLVIIRPANVYGPRSSFWTVGLLTMIDAGRLTLIDDGRGQSNHVYIDNLVDAILSAARTDSAGEPGFHHQRRRRDSLERIPRVLRANDRPRSPAQHFARSGEVHGLPVRVWCSNHWRNAGTYPHRSSLLDANRHL